MGIRIPVSVRQFGWSQWEGMAGRDVGLLSTRRKTCDRSAGQGSVMEGGSMSARHRAVIVRYKGQKIRNIRGKTALPHAEHSSR